MTVVGIRVWLLRPLAELHGLHEEILLPTEGFPDAASPTSLAIVLMHAIAGSGSAWLMR